MYKLIASSEKGHNNFCTDIMDNLNALLKPYLNLLQ